MGSFNNTDVFLVSLGHINQRYCHGNIGVPAHWNPDGNQRFPYVDSSSPFSDYLGREPQQVFTYVHIYSNSITCSDPPWSRNAGETVHYASSWIRKQKRVASGGQ